MKTLFKTIAAVLLIAGSVQCSKNKASEQIKTPEKATDVAESEMTKEYITTFQINQPDKITIEAYDKMSAQQDSTVIPKRAEVTDVPTITRILELVKALPDKGEIMKKLGDVPLLEVKLIYKDKVIFFDYYNESVKTPDTSFFASSPAEEKQLFELLNSLII